VILRRLHGNFKLIPLRLYSDFAVILQLLRSDRKAISMQLSHRLQNDCTTIPRRLRDVRSAIAQRLSSALTAITR
jgi:hypothetical protein